ncbi:MAG TPA: GNAT family N-acetyltransferase [Candidatus Omnitrophota bacterium]|nr:GNAT family N-acetyltransferase [Candidatus Omnitrophota bacterium]
MMQNLNYQRYLNCFIPFDSLLWNAFSRDRRSAGCKAIVSRSGRFACRYCRLDWDSAVLGINVYKVSDIFFSGPETRAGLAGHIEKVERALKADGAQLAVFRFGMEHMYPIRLLCSRGWGIVDVMNIYGSGPRTAAAAARVAPRRGLSFSRFSLREAREFFRRAEDIFVYSRMYNDPRISRRLARMFYSRLFEDVCSKPESVKIGLYAGRRLVGLALGETDGFLTNTAGFKLGYLWEIAVDPGFRQRGYAAQLFSAFLKSMSGQADHIEVGTQVNNTAANRLYAGAGLVHRAHAVTFHKWLA